MSRPMKSIDENGARQRLAAGASLRSVARWAGTAASTLLEHVRRTEPEQPAQETIPLPEATTDVPEGSHFFGVGTWCAEEPGSGIGCRSRRRGEALGA